MSAPRPACGHYHRFPPVEQGRCETCGAVVWSCKDFDLLRGGGVAHRPGLCPEPRGVRT